MTADDVAAVGVVTTNAIYQAIYKWRIEATQQGSRVSFTPEQAAAWLIRRGVGRPESRIAALCRKRELCPYALARRLGVSEATARRIVREDAPLPPSLRVKLARVLRVDERELEG